MIEQRIRARVGAYSVPAVVHAVQGDTGRVFVFELEDYTVTGAEGASLNCMRPDGSFYTYAGTVSTEDNTVTVALDVEGGALTQEGVVTFQLELVEAGLIVCTFRGSIIVEPVVGGEATQEEKDFRDAIQAQLNDKASNAQLAQVESDLTDRINGVSDDLAQEILDRESADATKANKSTTINGKSLETDRVIYAQDVPSKNLLPNTATTQTINGVTFTVNSDGSVTVNGTATATTNIYVAQSCKTYGSLVLNGCPAGGAANTYKLGVEIAQSPWSGLASDFGEGAAFSPSVPYNVFITISSGAIVSNLTFYPMIRLASIEDAEYVPYAKTNVELSQGLIDISSAFVWNPNVTFSTKTLVAFYDPVRHLVMGNMAYDASAAISSSTYHIQIASAYRPKSNSAQPCMYYHSSDSAWKVASLTFGANGNITQGTTNYWKSTLCSFMYSV